MSEVMQDNYYYSSTMVFGKFHCANENCKYHEKEKFPIHDGEYMYRLKGVSLPFCSYNCRCEYQRNHIAAKRKLSPKYRFSKNV